MKNIVNETEYEFTEDSFFLGLGGVPANRWLSISPFTVPLVQFNKIESLTAEFQFDPVTEYYISPPELSVGDTALIVYPAYVQTPVC